MSSLSVLFLLVAFLGTTASWTTVGRTSSRRFSSLSMSTKKKIVITGVGAITPVGIGGDVAYKALCEGKSGIKRLPSWADEYPAQLAGIVDFDPKANGLKGKTIKRNARYTHFALAATNQAIADAGLDTATLDGSRFGCIIGSGIGGVEWFEDNCNAFTASKGGYNGLRSVDSFLIPALIANTASGMVAIDHGARGPNYCVTTACASGTHAIGSALKHMRDGEADIMIAGGSEAALTPLCYAGFCALTAMATKYNDTPEKASRPFDSDRAGFIMAEGAGILILETEEHALARGATIYCELAGYGSSCDAYHITAPSPGGDGLMRCMDMALKDGGLVPTDVGYINAHGTSTQLNDKTETQAIKSLFGDHAYKLKISSIKSMIGHSLGAAGGIEAVVCAKIMKEGIVPPTMNCDNPDLEAGCDLDYVPNKSYTYPTHADIPTAILSDNLGFGGHNAAIAFKKYTPS
jgi:3-oxoacyl-[acyl-carrier-protein] synthase II